ncbi:MULTISPECIES: hypothetical protein [Streptomyces]|nr:hypothetical protein [Streptomyces sp. NEAU-383]
MELVEPGEPDTEWAALAFDALQAVQQAGRHRSTSGAPWRCWAFPA